MQSWGRTQGLRPSEREAWRRPWCLQRACGLLSLASLSGTPNPDRDMWAVAYCAQPSVPSPAEDRSATRDAQVSGSEQPGLHSGLALVPGVPSPNPPRHVGPPPHSCEARWLGEALTARSPEAEDEGQAAAGAREGPAAAAGAVRGHLPSPLLPFVSSRILETTLRTSSVLTTPRPHLCLRPWGEGLRGRLAFLEAHSVRRGPIRSSLGRGLPEACFAPASTDTSPSPSGQPSHGGASPQPLSQCHLLGPPWRTRPDRGREDTSGPGTEHTATVTRLPQTWGGPTPGPCSLPGLPALPPLPSPVTTCSVQTAALGGPSTAATLHPHRTLIPLLP